MSGARWIGHAKRQARKACFAQNGHTCFWCGHGAADAVDHLIPRARGGELFDPANLAPIHGARGCPTCGRICNTEKSDKPLAEAQQLRTSRDWYA